MARRELDLIKAMGLDQSGNPSTEAVGERVSQSPQVLYFRNFLTAAECAFLIDIARPQLQAAVVVDPQTGEFIRDPVRTSDSVAFPFVSETPAIHAINRRIAQAAQQAPEHGEPVQVLRYRPGEEYKPHSDALGGEGNQRVLTFLVYLNEAFEGGETLFIRSGMKVRGRTGDAILFRNVGVGGRPDPMAVHAGLPVTRGEKLLLSKWIRERPLDLTGPPGRPF